MNFLDLNKEHIRKNSTLVDNDFYEYVLGNQIDITSIKGKHSNDLIARNLSSALKEDKLMIRYQPTNKVYFSKDFIDTEDDENFASCYIDEKSSRVYVGSSSKFQITTGVLTFSGYLSLNNLIEKQKVVLGNNKVITTLMKRVRILALGLKDDMLFGLYYIPQTRGLALGKEGSSDYGISVTTLKPKDCSNYTSFTIDDWFEGTKIVER